MVSSFRTSPGWWESLDLTLYREKRSDSIRQQKTMSFCGRAVILNIGFSTASLPQHLPTKKIIMTKSDCSSLRHSQAKLFVLFCLAISVPTVSVGQETTSKTAKNSAKASAEVKSYDDLILSDEPVAYWNFSPDRTPSKLPGSMLWTHSVLGKPTYKNPG